MVGQDLNDPLAQLYWQSCTLPCPLVLTLPSNGWLVPTIEHSAVTSAIQVGKLRKQT